MLLPSVMAGLQVGCRGANTQPGHPAIIRCAMSVINGRVGFMAFACGLGNLYMEVKQSDGDSHSIGSMWPVALPPRHFREAVKS